MIEPEEMKRFRRHLETMLRLAGDDAASFAQVVGLAQELEDGLADAAALCRREGYSFGALAQELGTTKSGAHERFGMRPRPLQVDVARRRMELGGLEADRGTRLTAIGWEVWASQSRGQWVHLRTCATVGEAEELAAYLADAIGAWQLVRRPRDLPQWAEVQA